MIQKLTKTLGLAVAALCVISIVQEFAFCGWPEVPVAQG